VLSNFLRLRVIGEGVETPAELDILGSLGCDEIQGFVPGKPSFDVAGAGNQFAQASGRRLFPPAFSTALRDCDS
jgi:EAL domain-containing protein (putative c-di-GMP-specific phosphodiesterase class I)